MRLIVDSKGTEKRIDQLSHQQEVLYQTKALPDWRKQVEEGLRRNRYRESLDPSERTSIRIPWQADRYQAIVFTGDWHIGAEGFDWEKWKRDMEIILHHPGAKMFLMGDLTDNFTWNPGTFEQVFNPHEQTSLLASFLSEAMDKEKIAGWVGGNHTEEWLLKNSGLEYADVLIRFMRLPYLREGGLVYIDTGKVVYSILARHRTRYNSSFNMQHGNRRAFHMEAHADIVVSGHTHELGVSDEWLTVEGKPKHVILVKSGSYKRFDRYSKQKGYPQRETGSAVVIFNPFTHELFATSDVIRGIMLLDKLNADKYD